MENHHFSWENPRNKWPFSMAMLVYQRVHEKYARHVQRDGGEAASAASIAGISAFDAGALHL